MVKETRQIFDLGDVRAVRFRCSRCGDECVQSLDAIDIPLQCPRPQCEQVWEPVDSSGKSDRHWMLYYANRLKLHEKSPPMTVRFEIDGEQE